MLFSPAASMLARRAESALRGARPPSWLSGHPGAEGPDNAVCGGMVAIVGGGARIPDQAVVDGGHQRLGPVRRTEFFVETRDVGLGRGLADEHLHGDRGNR